MNLVKFLWKYENKDEMSSKRLQVVFARSLQDVLEDEKLLRWRRVEDQQMFDGRGALNKKCSEKLLKIHI